MANIFQRWLSALRLGCLAAGTCFLLLSVGLGIHTKLFIQNAATATGTVTQLTAVQDNDHQTMYAPTFTVGEIVPVLYKASNPADASIATPGELWGFTVAFGLAGIVTLSVGLALTLIRRRRLNASLTQPKEINVH